MDAGVDYNRYELINLVDQERVIFEWDNWSEGEIKALSTRLAALREKYRLSKLVEIEE